MVSSLPFSIVLCSYSAVLLDLECCLSFYIFYFRAIVCPFRPWLAYSVSFPGPWMRSGRGPCSHYYYFRRGRTSRCRLGSWRTWLRGWAIDCRTGTGRSSCTGRSIPAAGRNFSPREARGFPGLLSSDCRRMKHPGRRSRTRPHTTGTAPSSPSCARDDHRSNSRRSECLRTAKGSSWSGSQSSDGGLFLNGEPDACGCAGGLG